MTKATTIFRRWTEREATGEDFVYCTAGSPRDPALFEYARKLSDGGLVLLYQRRSSSGFGFDHVARRITQNAARFIDAVSASVKRRRPGLPRELAAPYGYFPGTPAAERELCLDYQGD